MERIAVQILACDYRAYKLMSQHSRISSRFPADDLNEVDDHLIETIGGSIPMEPEYQAGKEVLVPLSTAVAQENNCGSITNAQRARRATATSGSRLGSGSRPAIASDGELISAIATATDVVSNVTNALANSPVRQPRRQPEPVSPVRRPRRRLDPLPNHQPEPVKKTRKRRVVEDAGEVDLGPRKLRSRK
jgi:hypothetical protein